MLRFHGNFVDEGCHDDGSVLTLAHDGGDVQERDGHVAMLRRPACHGRPRDTRRPLETHHD